MSQQGIDIFEGEQIDSHLEYPIFTEVNERYKEFGTRPITKREEVVLDETLVELASKMSEVTRKFLSWEFPRSESYKQLQKKLKFKLIKKYQLKSEDDAILKARKILIGTAIAMTGGSGVATAEETVSNLAAKETVVESKEGTLWHCVSDGKWKSPEEIQNLKKEKEIEEAKKIKAYREAKEEAKKKIEESQGAENVKSSEVISYEPKVDKTAEIPKKAVKAKATKKHQTKFKSKEDQELWDSVADDYNAEEEGLQPHVAHLKRFLGAKFGIQAYSLFRPGDNDGTGHGHGNGLAVDLMVTPGDPLGDEIAEYLVNNYHELGIYYIIWEQKYYMHMNNIYGGAYTWNWMPDRGSVTQNHYDHVHISFQ